MRSDPVALPAPADPGRSSRTPAWLRALAIVAMTWAAYWPALHAGFIWDDDYYVTHNPTLRDADGLRRIWFDVGATPQYYPLVHTTFWIEFHLWGLWPGGYHAVNVALHALVALLIWRVLLMLGAPGAWWVAAIFAVHPVQVESVAWVTERKNVLSATFYFASMLLLIRAMISEPRASARAELPEEMVPPTADNTVARPGRSAICYAAAFILFVLALLSKTVTCTLPAAMLLILWWKHGRLTRGDLARLAPMFAVGIAFGLMTARMEADTVGAVGDEWDHTFIERCLIAGNAVVFYASKLLWPATLTFFYPRWQIDADRAVLYMAPVVVMATLTMLWLSRRRWGKAPLVAALCFVGTLFPALGFIDVYPMRYSYVADHFQYHASAYLIALLTAAACIALARGQHGRGEPRASACAEATAPGRRCHVGSVAVGTIVLAVLSLRTWQQCHVYMNLETLWRDTLAMNPAAWMAHNNLGSMLHARGDIDEAVGHYEAALRLRPDDPEAHYNLGRARMAQEQFDSAIAHFLAVMRQRPDHARASYNLGLALRRVGRTEEAIEPYRRAIEIEPQFAEAHYALGIALRSLDRTEEAIAAYRAAVAVDSGFAEAHNNLAAALVAVGRSDEALEHYRAAVALRPGFGAAHRNLADLLAMRGAPSEAIEHYRAALQTDATDADAMRGAAWIMATSNEPGLRDAATALMLAERANELSGGANPAALDVLAAAAAAGGDFDRAVRTAELAIAAAVEAGQGTLASQIRERLDAYRARRAPQRP